MAGAKAPAILHAPRRPTDGSSARNVLSTRNLCVRKPATMKIPRSRFAHDESGVTSLEYAFIGALIFMVIVGAVGSVAPRITPALTKISTTLAGAIHG